MNTNQGNPPQNGGEPPANNQNDRGKRKKHISKKKRQQRKVRDQLAKERCKIRRLFKTGENYSFEKELTVEELIEQNWTRLSADDFEKIRNTWEKMYANDVTVGSFHDIFESKLPPFLRPVDAVDDAEAAETAQEVEWTAERNPNDAAATRVKPMAPNSENRINDIDGKDAAGAARASKDKGNGDDELKDKKRKLSTNDNGQKKAKSTTHGADDSCEVAKGWVGPSDRDAMQDKEIKDHQEKLKTPFHDEGYTTSRGTDGKVDAIVKGNAPVPATNATAVLPRLKTHADGTTKLLVVNEEMEDEGKLIKAARKKIIEEKAPIRATDATKVLAATSVPKTDLKDDTSSLNKSYIRAASKQVVSVSKIAKRMALARAKNVRKDLDSSSGKRESGILNATSPTVWSSKISTMTTKRPSGNRPPSGRPSKKQKQPTRRLTRADCGTTYHSGSPESIEEGSRCYYFGTDRVLHPIFVGKINEEKKIQVTMILTERLRSKLFSDSECTIEVPADGIFAYLRAPEVKVGDKKYIAVEKAARTFANSHGTDSYGEKTVCASDEIDAVRKVIKPGLYQVGNSCIFYCCNGNQSLRDMSQKKFLRVPHAKIARDNAHLVEDVGADEQVATFIPKEGEIILLPIYFQGRPVVGNKEIQPSDAGQLPRLPMKSPKTIQPKDATSAQLSQLPMKSLNGTKIYFFVCLVRGLSVVQVS